MTFEWIGVATLVAGLLSLIWGRRFAVTVCILATLFGAAAASVLTALGGSGLPPAYVLLGFLVLVSLRRDSWPYLLRSIRWPQPGLWLVLTAAYACLASVFMPRIFAGATYVFTIARTDAGTGLLLTPLGPVSGNLTQTIYFVGDAVCFAVFAAFARDRAGKRWMTEALIAAGCLNLIFALLDYATFFTGTADALAFMRNAPYRMLDTAEVIGFKRLVGSFPEASAFASMTLALFAFTFSLWLSGFRTRITGPLAGLLCAALVLSTSTTAYAGLVAYLGLVFAASLLRLVTGRATVPRLGFLVIGPLLGILVVCAVLLNDALTTSITDILQQLIFSKGNSSSAMERGSWNSQALVNFFDSYGLGVGVGSARASNVVIAVLANIGIPGALTYAAFLVACLLAPRTEPDPEMRVIREAAASSCLSLFIAGCMAGTTIDLGLLFFICAALAATPTGLLAAMRPAPRAVPARPSLRASGGPRPMPA
ncbi:hypothetical protein [Methylobacterium dankookense]|uniref:Uncharacterized protein n=1 Tax=Methylobacterium dankookense TaxID=560405 RepID=A0A564FY16_9HYPH|nr:hypothetical protein [Methylobacterium dankookense]GJD54722.1 hypothetical protein IFDJLNFL_0601 [Methylobacterium dankookense]VUF12590.1 hypothetical protein MTDSW087_02283 [Methylobacterium dankookense]